MAGFSQVAIDFFRGELLGSAAPAVTFEAYYEEAHEAEATEWEELNPSPIGPDGVGLYNLTFSRRYFRMRIVLTADDDKFCAITCWASGSLVQRVAGD